MTTHATPGELRLRLHLPAGRIDITTWDEPTADVQVEPLDGSAAARPSNAPEDASAVVLSV